MLVENGFWHEIATQDHSRSFILQSVTGRQGVAYRHSTLLALSLNFRRTSHSNRQKLSSSTTHSHLTPRPRRTPMNIRIHLIFPETRVIGLHFCHWQYGLSSFKFVQRAPKDASICNRVCFGCSRSSKVDDFGTNRKRVRDFLLVRHCDTCTVSEIRRLNG